MPITVPTVGHLPQLHLGSKQESPQHGYVKFCDKKN